MKKIICISLIVLSVFAAFAFCANADEKAGITFAVDELYRTSTTLEKHPHTYEAWVNVDKNAPASNLGVIAGNYKSASTNSYGFEIRENGNPFLWLGYGASGKRISFTDVDLRTGEWTHVAITYNDTTAYCYVNGELKQTISATLTEVDMSKTGVLCIGGDLRSGNSRWLQKTELSSVAIFSDIRTEDEIKADMESVALDDDNILVAYDFTEANTGCLKDLSPNGKDLTYTGNTLKKEKNGITFAVDELYRTSTALEKHPHTYEAWVNVDKDAPATQLGVIAGNYKSSSTNSYGFEIRTNGNPFLWLGYGASGKRIAFDEIDLRTGKWTHVAITYNDTTAYCYINGELKQTISATLTEVDMSKTGVLCIGGDLRSANARWLQNTKLSSVAIYSDIRTEDEIKADMESVALDDANILVAYDFTKANTSCLEDLSPNDKDLIYSGNLLEDVEPDVEETGGMTFTNEPYKLVKKIDTPINTLEATVYFPKTYNFADRGGVIFGNYNVTAPCVNFEIYSNGSPRLYITDAEGKAYSYVFDTVNVYTGKWVHIAIVRENSETLSCYIDGKLAQTLTKTVPEAISNDFHILGGDLRSGNEQYFKGRIKNFAIYSDARTADEIKADVESAGKNELICLYELDGITAPQTIPDKSGNGYDAKFKSTYFTEKDPLQDYAYSFAVIGDTQILSLNYPDKYTALYDWVLNNVEQKKIKFVMGLGDITNNSTTAEWELAKQNITRLNGVVPYSLVRGNHDTTATMNNYFPLDDYKDTLGGYYGSTIFNSWQELIVGDIKYLIFTLDYGANDNILNWASEIIEAHPNHNVIITTHAYLYRDGTTLDSGDVCPPTSSSSSNNNGDHMWDKLMKKHKNIVLVLSGHDPCDYVVTTQTKGENGNTVTQMLIDPQGVDKAQGGVGLVTMLYFSADGKTVQVETYSTDKKAFFLEENQYTLTIDVVEAAPDDPDEPDDPNEPDDPSTGDGTVYAIILATFALFGMAFVSSKKSELNFKD